MTAHPFPALLLPNRSPRFSRGLAWLTISLFGRRRSSGNAHQPDRPLRWVEPEWWVGVAISSKPVIVLHSSAPPSDLLVPAVRGLTGLDAHVLIHPTMGSGAELSRQLREAYAGPLPPTVRSAVEVPEEILLDRAVCVVTDSAALADRALSHGAPTVCVQTASRRRLRVERRGAQLRLQVVRLTPADVLMAVARVLGSRSFAQAARGLQR